RMRIHIIDGGKPRAYDRTTFDAGPAAGDHLNGHFFPAVIAYNTGRYAIAAEDFTYCIRRPQMIADNPRQGEFMSISYYLLGMIYLHHADGVGRHALAKSDFEMAIKWNPQNHMAYLELSRVYSDLGFTKEAMAVINRLLELKPPKDIADEATDEIKKLS